jgi:vacuolar-type H+-ATPase subunit I/STV1
MTQILKDQKKVNFNTDEDFKILFNRVAENMGFDEDAAITDVVYKCFRRMDEKYKPDISRDEDIKKINELNETISELRDQMKSYEENYAKMVGQLDDFNDQVKSKSELINELKKKIEELENIIEYGTGSNLEQSKKIGELEILISERDSEISDLNAKLQKRVGLKENERVISFTDIQIAYLNDLINDKKFRDFVKEANKKGTFDGLIDTLGGNAADIITALKSWMFYCAKLDKYPLISFDRFLKSLKKSDPDE